MQNLKLIELELKELEKEKEESTINEEKNIHIPYQNLVEEITNFNDLATEMTINTIKQKALDWRKREIELKAKIDSLRTQSFNIFGVYNVWLIQEVLNIEPHWWNRFTNAREQWKQLTSKINNITKEEFIVRNLCSNSISDVEQTELRRKQLRKQFKNISFGHFSREKYYSLFQDWNTIINKLQNECDQLSQEKMEMILFLIKTVGNANNNISNNKVLEIIKEVFPLSKTEISLENNKAEEIQVSDEENLKKQLAEENQKCKEIMETKKDEIIKKTSSLKKVNKELNTSIDIWSQRLKKLKKQFNDYENKHGMSLKLKEINIRIITLEAKLLALLEKNQFKIKWYRELPSKFEVGEYVINENDLENAKKIGIPMLYEKDLKQLLEKYKITIKNKKYKIDNDNGSIVVAGVKKFELKLGNYGGSFEIPTLLQIPSFSQNGNSSILVSGNNTVNGNQSGSLSESGDVTDGSSSFSNYSRSLSESGGTTDSEHDNDDKETLSIFTSSETCNNGMLDQTMLETKNNVGSSL
ncbi:hypothetical protein [Spiroplasma endosymbiont of Cleonymus obscurus]|uniref:hypothetical protein n=1 Tax=Spiroplasma endosymbiont of Cleonymus obscurus TaxID=3066324 RepID=UPI0037DCB33A